MKIVIGIIAGIIALLVFASIIGRKMGGEMEKVFDNLMGVDEDDRD